MLTTPEIRVQLENWRGLSAYEVAVQNGFTGTQLEWLESLKGGTLQLTVCGKNVDADGNIVLYASDIKMQEGGLKSIAEAVQELDASKMPANATVNSLESDETAKPLSAAMGKALKGLAMTKAEIMLMEITVPSVGWGGDGPYTLGVEVEGITEACGVILGRIADGAENEEAFDDAELTLISRVNGGITLRAVQAPTAAFKVNLAVLVPGVSE